MKSRFVMAYWPWTWILKATGMAGLTMPWGSIYLVSEYFDNEWLRRHEMVHIAQMERDGRLYFCFSYLWQLLTKGYRNISYEIEAFGIDDKN